MRTAFLLLVSIFIGCQTTKNPPRSFTVDSRTIQVIGFMDDFLMKAPLGQLKDADPDRPVYLYLFSTDGDPKVAEKFVDAMEGKTTICLATAAGGGAFAIFQNCTHRLIHEKSAMGTSRVFFSGTTGDTIEDDKQRAIAAALTEKFSEIESDRLGIDPDFYDEMLDVGFVWRGPENILNENGADAQVDLGCSTESHSDTLTRSVFIPPDTYVDIVVTQCPVMRKLAEPKMAPGPAVGEILGFPIHGNVGGAPAVELKH